MRELAIIENIQREELNAIELALSYQELLEEYDITHEELSKRINKSRTQITNTLRLLQLCDEVKAMLSEEKITQGHAKMLVTLSESEQKLVADSIIGQRLSVRDTETLIKKLKNGQDSTAKDSISKAKPKGQAKNLDISLLEELKRELSSLGIQSNINATKLSIDFKSDAEITTLLKKIVK